MIEPRGSVPALRGVAFVRTQYATILGLVDRLADTLRRQRTRACGMGSRPALAGEAVRRTFLPRFHPARFIKHETQHRGPRDAAMRRASGRGCGRYPSMRMPASPVAMGAPASAVSRTRIGDVTPRAAMRTGVSPTSLDTVDGWRSSMVARPACSACGGVTGSVAGRAISATCDRLGATRHRRGLRLRRPASAAACAGT